MVPSTVVVTAPLQLVHNGKPCRVMYRGVNIFSRLERKRERKRNLIMHWNSSIEISLLFTELIYQRSWPRCSPSFLFASMHIILGNSAWASCKPMGTTTSRQNPIFESIRWIAGYLRILISAYVLLHLIAQCLNTQVSRIVLVPPYFSQYPPI